MKKIIAGGIAAAAVGTALAVAAPANAAEDFLVCPDGHSGIATTVTSCPFAENVRVAYLTQAGQVVEAYSPVTGQYYDMQCAPGFMATLSPSGRIVHSVRCVGGNNAVVVLF
jgi:hypothetical protein